jgi:hypothetical protein
MGIFDSARSVVRNVIPSVIGAAIGGPSGAIAAQIIGRSIETGSSGLGESSRPFTMSLPQPQLPSFVPTQATNAPILGSNVGVDVFNPLQTQETKTSGEKVVNMYENGPMQANVIPFAQQAGRAIGRTIFGGGSGGAVGGGIAGFGVGSMFGGGMDASCEPKPFVRLDKCNRPIITRAMQAKAKEMVMCLGIEAAAEALGIDTNLLAQIAFKRFKPRAKGISGAQLKTAKRVARQMHMAQKQFKAAVMGRKC